MTIYQNIDKWRLNLINNPPKSAQHLSSEEWKDIVLNELTSKPNIFEGEKNGNYGNPTNYKHGPEQIENISKNHSKHWQGKDVPWKGCTRPDNYDRMHLLWDANRGKPSWNSGMKVGPYSEDHKAKISQALKGKPKPIITCPHCGKSGGAGPMKLWHFDNCKVKDKHAQNRNFK